MTMIRLVLIKFSNIVILSYIAFIHADDPRRAEDEKSPSHAQRVPHDIELTPLDLLPPNSDLDHRDLGALREHQHLHIKDPPFTVHKRHDIRQGRAREQFEPALRVSDRRSGRRRHGPEEPMKRTHQKLPEQGPLDRVFAVDQVRAAPDPHSPVLRVLRAHASVDQSADVRDPRRAVCVCECDVCSPRVPHAVGHGAAFAAVFFERDHADAAEGDVDWLLPL